MTLAAGMLAAQAPSPLPRIGAHIRPDDLKADVSFLASDALEGRGTPSRGLDIAAEYIAAQFRRAGLEPASDDGYFQNARYEQMRPNPEGLSVSFNGMKAAGGSVAIQDPAAADIADAEAFKIVLKNVAALDALTTDEVRGKVLIVQVPDGGGGNAGMQAQRRLSALAVKLEPLLVVLVRGAAQPTNPNARVALREASLPSAKTPILTVWDKAIRDAVVAAPVGPLAAKISAHVAAPLVTSVKLRNVVGILRGADPELKDTYVIVTGHYDHLGIRPDAQGDSIFNGANDDASGTASVIAVAGALNSLAEKPKRSIVFITVFGEEMGGYGARWYTSHPIFPMAKTVADINLEQLGRTDDTEGPNVSKFNLTGFDYSDIAATFAKAGEQAGVKAVKHETNSDAFFSRSDNATFADAGIPSTTLSVAYEFPDYHGAGDEWPKLDYENMARVDVAVALGVWDMANNPQAPQWNRDNPKAARYVEIHDKR